MEVTLSKLFNDDITCYDFVASSCAKGKLFEFYPETCLSDSHPEHTMERRTSS